MDYARIVRPTDLRDLPEDHPARLFARQVNPAFG